MSDLTHTMSDLRKNGIVSVILLGFPLQLSASFGHKGSHLVENEPGVWVLWRRDFKQAMSIITICMRISKCRSQGEPSPSQAAVVVVSEPGLELPFISRKFESSTSSSSSSPSGEQNTLGLWLRTGFFLDWE